MLITSKIKLTSDMENLLKQLYKQKKISRRNYSDYLRECENSTYDKERSPLKLFNISIFKGYSDVVSMGKEIGITLSDYTGWRVYNRDTWLHWKKNEFEKEAKYLEKPENWFPNMIAPKNKVWKLVKYNDEIEECLRLGKDFYNVGMTMEGQKLDLSLQDTQWFEKIIYIENSVTKTRLYYGVWS